MESSIAVFLMRQLACEQLPTMPPMQCASACMLRAACCAQFGDASQRRTDVATCVCGQAERSVSQETNHCLQKMRNLEHHSVHFITHQSFTFY